MHKSARDFPTHVWGSYARPWAAGAGISSSPWSHCMTYEIFLFFRRKSLYLLFFDKLLDPRVYLREQIWVCSLPYLFCLIQACLGSHRKRSCYSRTALAFLNRGLSRFVFPHLDYLFKALSLTSSLLNISAFFGINASRKYQIQYIIGLSFSCSLHNSIRFRLYLWRKLKSRKTPHKTMSRHKRKRF